MVDISRGDRIRDRVRGRARLHPDGHNTLARRHVLDGSSDPAGRLHVLAQDRHPLGVHPVGSQVGAISRRYGTWE